LATLRRFDSGSYQLDIGENRFSSVSICTAEIPNALNNLNIVRQYISFSDSSKKLNIAQRG